MSIVQVINNENPPVKSKHIYYMVQRDGNKVILSELLENCYPHPDAPEHCPPKHTQKRCP